MIKKEIKLEIYHIIASHMAKNCKSLNSDLVKSNIIKAKIVSETDSIS